VVNIKKNHRPLPLFHVELALKENNKEIFKITKLLHSTIMIEKPHTERKNPPQCYTCKAYGHTRNYYTVVSSPDALNAAKITQLICAPKIVVSLLNVHYALVHIQHHNIKVV